MTYSVVVQRLVPEDVTSFILAQLDRTRPQCLHPRRTRPRRARSEGILARPTTSVSPHSSKPCATGSGPSISPRSTASSYSPTCAASRTPSEASRPSPAHMTDLRQPPRGRGRLRLWYSGSSRPSQRYDQSGRVLRPQSGHRLRSYDLTSAEHYDVSEAANSNATTSAVAFRDPSPASAQIPTT